MYFYKSRRVKHIYESFFETALVRTEIYHKLCVSICYIDLIAQSLKHAHEHNYIFGNIIINSLDKTTVDTT